MNKKDYSFLPKIQVSFQDHFCGCPDEVTSTVKYIVDKLLSMSIKPEIGTKILLWEEDIDNDNKKYNLCNIGEIVELSEDKIREYSEAGTTIEKLIKLDDKKVMVQIDKDAYFDVYDVEFHQ